MPKRFESFAQVKRAMVVGSVWDATYHFQSRPGEAVGLGTAPVHRRQTDCVTFIREGRESWFYFPKSSDIKFAPDSLAFSVTDNGTPVLTYTLKSAAAAPDAN